MRLHFNPESGLIFIFSKIPKLKFTEVYRENYENDLKNRIKEINNLIETLHADNNENELKKDIA